MVSVMHGYFGTETFEPLLYIRNGRKRLDTIKMTIKDLTVILISFSLILLYMLARCYIFCFSILKMFTAYCREQHFNTVKLSDQLM